MNDENSDQLLWELSRLPGAEESAVPSDETIQAYQDGRLGAGDAESLELLLSRSPRARARLLELGGVEPPAVPADGLNQVVRAFERGHRWRHLRVPCRAIRWQFGAAAALATALLLVVLTPLLRPVGLPADLRYDITVRGLATDRSAGPAGASGGATADVHIVDPDTRVEIVAAPVGAPVSGTELGLYRLRSPGNTWIRLTDDPRIEIDRFRGGATLRVLARDLLGSRDGRQSLLLVIAKAGDLPPSLALDPGTYPVPVLEAGGRRRVYPLTFDLKPLPASTEPGQESPRTPP